MASEGLNKGVKTFGWLLALVSANKLMFWLSVKTALGSANLSLHTGMNDCTAQGLAAGHLGVESGVHWLFSGMKVVLVRSSLPYLNLKGLILLVLPALRHMGRMENF